MNSRSLQDTLLPMVACLALAGAPAASAADYMDDQPSVEAMLVDGVLVRPLGIGATAVGIVGWVVTLPFSLLGGNAGEAAQTMIVKPAAFTFTRPLGEL